MSGLHVPVCAEEKISLHPSSGPSLSQRSLPPSVQGEQNPTMKEKTADAVLILDEYLGISYYNQEFSYLESADEGYYIGKNLMQCFFRIIPHSMYEYIETIMPGMVIRKTHTIHAADQDYCFQYQILGTLHGNGRPGVIILIKPEPDILCT
jgi:hypothetical protein